MGNENKNSSTQAGGEGAKNFPPKSEHMRGTLTKLINSKEIFMSNLMTKLMTKPMTFEKLMTKFQNLMTEILS